jgi:hypothetical protein
MTVNTPTSTRATLVGTFIAVAVLMSGCGSSSSNSASGSGALANVTKSNAAKSGATALGGSSSGGGKTVDVCALMPAESVANISGEPITVAKEDTDKVLTSSGIFTCDYTSADGTSGLDLTVHETGGKIGYDADLQAAKSVQAAGTKTISGLGDKAFSAVDGVHALFGDVEIEVSGLSLAASAVGLGSGDSVGPAKTLITTLHSKL